MLTHVIVGLDRAQAFVDSLPEFVQDGADRIMGSGAEMVSAAAKELVPVRTGKLQRSIQVVKGGPCIYVVGSDVGYSGFVEFGTSRMRAQPYLRPAWDQTQPQLVNSIVSMIEQLRSEFLL